MKEAASHPFTIAAASRSGFLPTVKGTVLALAAQLAARGSVWVRGDGHSMAPTVRHGDEILLRAVSFRDLRRGDIVAVASSAGAILHRITRIASDGSVETAGDARVIRDGLCSPGDVLAVAVLAERDRSLIALRPTFEFGPSAYARGALLLVRLRLARRWRRIRVWLQMESD